MDYDVMIKHLKKSCRGESVYLVDKERLKAAETMSTLHAENAKLRNDVIRFNDILASYQNVLVPELRAELEKVKAERDEAEKEISHLKLVMRERGIYTIPAIYPWEKPEWNMP